MVLARFLAACSFPMMALALPACLGGDSSEGLNAGEESGSEESALGGAACAANQSFSIGSGIYDVTGAAAELGMMGYAMLEQKTEGIHTRLRSRAFVISSPCNGKRVAFVSADLQSISQGVKQQVIEKLKATYGSLYSDDNVMLSATHTHSGPGGFSHYALYNLTILGFDKQNFDAIVNGIYQSIVRAHNNLGSGAIRVAEGNLLDASINRSSPAYVQNPAAERAGFGNDTDKLMTALRLQKSSGKEIGTINWFAVHATSMGNDNRLISGDNKGYASYLFEKAKGTDYSASETFVAAFAQSNEGDVSPNILSGENGGGADDFESTSLSGTKQYNKGLALYNSATELLTGGVDYRHAFVRLDNFSVAPQFGDGAAHTTCTAAIGNSMIAGAEDGPGFGNEGWTCQNVTDFFGQFTCAVQTTSCQGAKPIILTMGSMQPFPWTPEVLPVQIATIGTLAIVAVPFELTTMSGRRLRQTVANVLQPAGISRVVIAGLSNAYAGYVATREEYGVQHYEGASTHFGPWTLSALQQEFNLLAVALRDGTAVNPGSAPRDLRNNQTTVQTGVVYDDKPLFVNFGSVITDAAAGYARGSKASVTFWGGHPKNDLKIQGSYLQVQKKSGTSWVTVANDWDWETKYTWKRDNCVPTFGCSRVTIEWAIPSSAPVGTYRIRHDGNWKSGLDGLIRPYTGFSREFSVN
jgi:neutral ceramidase